MMTKLRLTGPMIMAAMLAACGSGDKPADDKSATATPAAAAAAIDPCSLLTVAEVTEIVGDKILSAKADGGRCAFATDDMDSVAIEIDQADAKGRMEIDRKVGGTLAGIGGAVADQGGPGADVNAMLQEGGDTPKLGDEALWGPNTQLSIRKGNSYIAISPPIMHSRISYSGNPLISTDDKRKMAVALAEKALARLP